MLKTQTKTEAPLRRIREAQGRSQRWLASEADCALSTVWTAEKGGFLSPRMAERFAKALGVDPVEFRP